MADRSALRSWFSIAALLIAMLGAVVVFALQHERESKNDAHAATEREVALLKSLLEDELQAGNYQIAAEVLQNWGSSHEDIAVLRLLGSNGFIIAEYLRPEPAREDLTLETPIEYGYAGKARFILSKDLGDTTGHATALFKQLAAAYGAVAAVILLLNYLHLQQQRQSGKLRAEVAQREIVEKALRESEARFRNLTEMSSDFFWESDAEHRLTLRSESAREAQEHTFERQSSVGKRRWEVPSVSPDESGWQKHRETLDAHQSFRNFVIARPRTNGVVHYIAVSGDPVFNADGKFTGYRGVGADITERKLAEQKINELAFYDQLTGLPNRTLLHDRLRQAMAGCGRSGEHGALLLIDMDNFKKLNDTLGHDVGDLLLKEVALRLTASVRAGDTVARLGGDEFVVVLASLNRHAAEAGAQCEIVCEKILAVLNQTYQLKDVSYRSTPSIGITLFDGHATEIDVLLRQADLAMYRSKDAGRNTVRFFDPDMEHAVMTRVRLENDLRAAIDGQQFLLHYQAQIAGGQLTGAEVLARWQHPERGMVSPAEFIPLAEETGLIVPLGQWVLDSACRQLVAWATQPEMAHLTIAVNVSAHQFGHVDFVNMVFGILERTGANPERLKLELTESLLVGNVEAVVEKMFALKAKGVGFSLDDFGTGYSSLSYLKRLPLDQLKIDQSFVRDVLTDPNDASIARTIIALAQNLGLGVIAEGVETKAQRDFLASSGCHAYQGYFLSRPLSIDDFEQFVRRSSSPPEES